MNNSYGWDYTELVDNKEDEEKGGTDGEDFVIAQDDDDGRDDMTAVD